MDIKSKIIRLQEVDPFWFARMRWTLFNSTTQRCGIFVVKRKKCVVKNTRIYWNRTKNGSSEKTVINHDQSQRLTVASKPVEQTRTKIVEVLRKYVYD